MADAMTADVEIRALRDEVRQLHRLVAEMDGDMAELEWHVEHMGRRASTHLYVLGLLLGQVFGRGKDADPDSSHGYAWRALYPMEGPDGQRQGERDRWNIPRRRWRQYGTRDELVALAVEHGLTPSRREGREWIVRRLRDAGVGPSLRH